MTDDEKLPIPPDEMDGRALDDMPLIIDTSGYGVFEWHPTSDGSGPPTAVALRLLLANRLDGAEVVLRITSRAELTRMITMLTERRDSVWPEG